MGVHGLWKLLDPAGKPVSLESLQNKVLAVDVSIWLNQSVKGFRDTHGNPLPNAHLLGLFHRVCKLLFYGIRPIFVFDGGVPYLKKQTLIARRQQKTKAARKADKLKEQLLSNLLRHSAVKKALSGKAAKPATVTSAKHEDDMFKLPVLEKSSKSQEDETEEYVSGSESDTDVLANDKWITDLHSVDVSSAEFKALPANVRHDILTDLKETRKQSSWGRMYEMPQVSEDFSSFQINRLLKRRAVQVCLEDVEQEIGDRTVNLSDLEKMLSESGVLEKSNIGNRIASDEKTRYLLVKGDSNASNKSNNVQAEATSELFVKSGTSFEDRTMPEKDSENKPDMSSESEDEAIMEKVHRYQQHTSTRSGLLLAKKCAQRDSSGLTQDEILATIKLSQGTPQSSISDNDWDKPGCSKSMVSLNDCDVKCNDFQNDTDHAETTGVSTKVDLDTNRNVTDINTTEGQDNISLEQKTAVTNKCEINANRNTLDKSVKPCKEDMKQVPVSISDETCFLSDSAKLNDSIDVTESSEHVVEISKEQSDSDSDLVQIDDSESRAIIDNSVDIQLEQTEVNKERDSKIDAKDIQNIKTSDKNKNLEIVIDPKSVGEDDDDIFADIFTDVKAEKVTSIKQNDVFEDKDSHKNATTVVNGRSNLQVTPVPLKPDLSEEEKHTTDDEVHKIDDSAKEEESDEDDEKGLRTQELLSFQSLLEKEADNLISEKGKQERIAASITDQMYVEAQELLQLFGIPYVIAPMEAEAQCAFLDLFSLTHGTITDDSDIWLFGGQRVYKNFFNQSKHVKFFQAPDIQRYFNLSRNHMILLALLVGSDYTVGIQGVGPVTAMEVLAEFPPKVVDNNCIDEMLTGLVAFRDWWEKKKLSIKSSLRNKLKEVELHPGFPSATVVDAYLHPVVDEAKESFSWSIPNLDSLRQFARKKFGWLQAKCDEILLPVVKKLNSRTSQMTLDVYFQIKIPSGAPPVDKLSKRVQRAVRRVGHGSDAEQEDEPPAVPQKKRRCNEVSQRRGRGRGRGSAHATAATGESSVSESIREGIPSQDEAVPHDRTAAVPRGSQRKGKVITLKEKQVGEIIPQRERDKVDILKRKLKAIEVFQKTRGKRTRGKGRQQRVVRKEMKEANLSESSDSD